MQTDQLPEANRTGASTPAAKPARRSLKRRALKLVALGIGSLALLLITGVAGLWWWAGTEGSLASALRWAGQSQPLTFERASGSLRAGGRVERLAWQQGGLHVLASDVALAWQPWSLLQGKLELTRLTAASVEVNDQRPPSEAPAAPPTSLGLPLRVVLENFSVEQLRYAGRAAFSATDMAGRYEFDGLQHRLKLARAQLASGRYSGQATLSSGSPLTLDAQLSGALQTAVPGSATPLALALQASARGPITDLMASAELQMTTASAASPQAAAPHASATARLLPWAAQPLAAADATFRDLDVAALWPQAPHTQLTGSASVRPLQGSAGTRQPGEQAWQLQTQLTNRLPGPWDQQRLPLDRLEARGEWRNDTALVRTLIATRGSGELVASGEWSDTGTSGGAAAQAWKMQATLQGINPALLHSKLAALPMDGQATVQSQGTAVGFEASVKARAGAGTPALARTPRGKNNPATQLFSELRLREASASGSWNAQQAGGTLVLSALRVRTDEAELRGQLEVQPAAQAGKGDLALTAPGVEASAKGELRPTSGGGAFALRGRDAAQALRWLQKLPGMPASLQTAATSGSAELKASWQGGWRDPALQATLEVPSLDWQTTQARAGATGPSINPAPAISGDSSASSAAPAGASDVLKIRALQATLSGRLTRAQLDIKGRIETGMRRYALELAAEGGRSEPAWQGVINQLRIAVEDPALGAGAWRLATRAAVPLKWTPARAGGATTGASAGGLLEGGAGEAVLSAPPARMPAAATASTPSQALLAWHPVRWQAGELTTAGRLTGLPMAWIELLAGPQLAGAGLASNLLLDGEWDARLGATLALKASLARSSGDLTVQAETAQGTSIRVAAGIKQARVSLVSNGDDVSVSLVWDSERAGTADGQLKTRLTRTGEGAGAGGWVWATGAPLEGRLRAQLPRIGVWSVLAPPGWRLRGSLATDLLISGTRAAPQLAGELLANDLALRSVVDGIEFGNGRLRARLDGTRMLIDEFSLQGAGDKGAGGTLTARGEAGWLNGQVRGQPQMRLDARLERLRASLRTDRQLTVSGDLQASLAGKQAALGGSLVVDQARIILPEEGTPQLGDDVVVRTARGAAAGQKAPAETSMTREASVPAASSGAEGGAVRLAMKIDLGPDFRVQGKGIDTRLRGTLTLAGESLRNPRLTGTINTAGGEYRAYGQRLDVEQGVLRFTGAIDNPTLDILAIRPNMVTQRVGVQILGTALLPRVRLYAQPELPDAEKLSWLIVGRASASGGAEAALLQQAALALLGSKSGGMSGGLAASLGLDELSFRGAASNENGSATQGAITLGKRFSRNFYAAYERSISGALGTLFIFYDLSQRFTVRAQAGQQSAVDLIYTVPYD